MGLYFRRAFLRASSSREGSRSGYTHAAGDSDWWAESTDYFAYKVKNLRLSDTPMGHASDKSFRRMNISAVLKSFDNGIAVNGKLIELFEHTYLQRVCHTSDTSFPTVA